LQSQDQTLKGLGIELRGACHGNGLSVKL